VRYLAERGDLKLALFKLHVRRSGGSRKPLFAPVDDDRRPCGIIVVDAPVDIETDSIVFARAVLDRIGPCSTSAIVCGWLSRAALPDR
jgi:hypothetical protein